MKTINIQEPQNLKLSYFLKGIAILMRYDCTSSINIGTTEAYYSPTYCIDTSIDSQDLTIEDLNELEQLGWKELDQGYYTTWYYQD